MTTIGKPQLNGRAHAVVNELAVQVEAALARDEPTALIMQRYSVSYGYVRATRQRLDDLVFPRPPDRRPRRRTA